MWLKSTSENVLTSYEPNGPYEYGCRYELDPEKETLTETQLDSNGAYTTVYDTKMSIEDGIFVEKGDLSKPTDPSKDENDEANTWYTPYLKDWRYYTHYWRSDIEYFAKYYVLISEKEDALTAFIGTTPYVSIEDAGDVGDGVDFWHNGEPFTRFGGGGVEVALEKESDTVLVGYNIDDEDNTFRLVFNPQKETLTVTETDADGVLVSIVYDTKMSPESGLYTDLGDLDNPNTESLNLTPGGVVRFVPTDTENGTELLMSEEDAVALAALINDHKWDSKAYKGTGDYIFTLGGQKFSVDVQECWFNLLDGNGTPMMKSVKLQDAAHIDAFKDLLSKATKV